MSVYNFAVFFGECYIIRFTTWIDCKKTAKVLKHHHKKCFFHFILIHEHHVKAILRAGGDIFGQLARTQNVVIGLLVSKIYPTKTLEIYSIERRKKEIFAEKFILLENRG